MFDWMFQSREEFLLNYFDIGNAHATSKELQEDHKHFSLSSMVTDFHHSIDLSMNEFQRMRLRPVQPNSVIFSGFFNAFFQG